ncbi:HYR domain-containing protein, partial [Flavobacterium aquidurense]|uniref:HYR domain-containing protein n=1 Tax=Flavobacterium aquidurense TaxID=362413 RepID=UPI002861B53E
MLNFTFRKFNSFKLIFIVLLLFATTQTRAQFPFFQSFKNNTAPGLQFGGSPVAFLTGGAGLKNGYNDPIGSGYLRLTNSDGNQKGITWSDTYAFPSAYGMTISFEYYTHGGNGADGIAFILFDATASPVTAGAFGGSLGYAQRNSEEGFSKGYLGIGIDEYGNFSANNEGKSGGVAVRSSNVTLRGKGTGLVGYPYLTSVQTTALASPFNVAGGDRTATDITKAGFRKMEVVLRPRSGGGFFIDVYLTHGSVRDLIINNYEYSTVSPSNLKFAISSSTGGSNNFHEIRNLNITVDPNTLLTPVASADSFSGCVGLAATSGDITANDNGTVNTLGTINKSTVDLDVLTPGIQTSKTLVGQGTFTYNSTTASVTFTPINNTIVGPVEIDYTFNDSYGKTSSSSKIKYTAYTPISDNVIAAPSQAIFCSGSANPDIINGLAATGGTINPLIYQWESSSDNITFSPISGATNVNYDPPLLSTTTYYRRIVTSAACSNTSNVVAIIFGQASTPTATSATTVTCDGFTANWKTVSNAQSYGLFVSKNSDFSTHEGNYDGRNLTTATSYSITGLTTGTTYYYKVVAINTCGSSAISSNAITVLVGSGSVPGSVSSPQTICSGTSPADLTLSGYAGTIQWQSSANNSTFNDISGATGPTLTSVQMGVLTANTYYRASVSSGACPATNSPSILVTINPNPTLGSAAQAATVCSGSTARINLTGLLTSSTFTISYSIDGVSQIPISGISSDATGAVGFDSAVLPSSANGKILKITGITITSATPNCNSIVNKDVTLSVNSPSVGGNIASVASICAGTSPANLVLNGNTGTVVKWQKASDVAFSTPVDIAGTSTTLLGSTIGNLTANTYFRAIVKNGICSAEFSGSVLVTVNSLPVALSLTGSTICTLPGGNGKITSTTSVSGITYQLYNSSNIAVQTAKAGTGSALSWTGLSAGNGYYVIGTNTSTTCSSPSNIVDVVNDTQKPTIACPSNVTAIADANSCAATGVVLGTPTTSDNCSGTVTVTNNAPSSFPIGVTTVTWTATDGMGNTQTCTQTVTVSDTQKPTITCPSNVTAVADANSCVAAGVVLETPTTSDNCIGTVIVTNNAPSSFPIGNTIVTWTATDAAGNTQTCTQTVTVSDTQKPTITCPSNVTAVADANSCVAAGVVLETPTTSDNCIGTVTVTNNAPSSFPIGNTIVTWTATDAAGNTQTCTQTVTVSDTQKPTITCPSNVTAVADTNSCVAAGVVLGTPTTSDNCIGTVTVTNNAPSSFPIGNTIVTWTATDAAGNTQTCTQTVTVSDTQKPTITCPSNVTAVADTNSCVATGVVLGTPATSDNCTGTVTVTNNAPSSFPIGVTTVTWTATDAAGNTQTCTQTVTVSDTQKPTITCPSNVTAVADTNSCVATGVVLETPTTSDNCIGTVTVTNNAPSSFPIGNTIVTWTATDAAGNTQTCIQTVTVSDTQKPTITCPSNVTAVADANSCTATGVVLGTPTTSDNCTGTITVTNNAPSSFPIGNTIVTWTATDAAGNTQTCTQTVTVSDTQKPTITCPSNVTAVADANSCVAAGVVLETPTTSDNCTGTVTVTNNAPSSFPIGNTIVTWTATDAAG